MSVCCEECFNDEEIKNFIVNSEQIGDCDYCGAKNVNIADVEEVGPFVKEGIERVYEDAAEHVPYETAEGGYQASTETINEILQWSWDWIFSERLDDPSVLIEDFNIDDWTPYVKQNFFGPVEGEHEERWNSFCEKVKHDQRYTILIKPKNVDDPLDESEHPSTFIENITNWVYQELFNIIPSDTTIYRARRTESKGKIGHLGITSPSPDRAGQNRMSPAGISFFYGAMERDTAIAEVRPGLGDNIVVGTFKSRRPLGVIDFTQIPSPTSPFNSERYGFDFEEFILPFLESFAEQISRPIRPEDSAIDYVPTQVFTEFLRTSIRQYDPQLEGIIFESSMKDTGKCLTLFKGPDISCTPGKPRDNSWLTYKGQKSWVITHINYRHTLVKKND